MLTVEAVNQGLSRLRDQRVQQIVVEGRLLELKLAWKLAVYREVLLYLFVALTESIALNWNQANFLGAYYRLGHSLKPVHSYSSSNMSLSVM